MDIKEVEHLVDCYLKQNEIKELKFNSTSIYFISEKIIKNYKKLRNRKIEYLIFDSLFFKGVEYTDTAECPKCTCKSTFIPQYSLFDKSQILCYLGFRTSIRNKRTPKNDFKEFFVLYVTEILNGLIDESFNVKLDLLLELYNLYIHKKSRRSNITILKSAFEILYVIHNNEISIEKYFELVPLSIFTNTNLSPDNKIIDDDIFPIYSIFSITYMFNRSYKNWLDVMEYCVDCLRFVYLEMLEKKDFKFSKFNSVKKLFAFSNRVYKDTAISGLNVLYPININFKYSNSLGQEEGFNSGTHYYLKRYNPSSNLVDIFIQGVCISMKEYDTQSYTGGLNKLKQYVKLNSYDVKGFNSVKVDMNELTVLYKMIDEAVGKWINNGKKVAFPNHKYISETQFEFDFNKINLIREKSNKIQEKLIIEESDDEFIMQPSVSDGIKIDLTQEEGSFESFMSLLSQCEKDILLSLLSNDVEGAEDIAFKEGQPLTVIVDNINTKSNLSIEDIVIEENIVVDDYVCDIKSLLDK